MGQTPPMEPYEQDGAIVSYYREQAREFFSKGRQYLADGALHQAAEKVWGPPHG